MTTHEPDFNPPRTTKSSKQPETPADLVRPFLQPGMVASVSELGLGKIHGKAAKIIAECAQTGEPVFVFRAKDLLSIFALKEYEKVNELYGAPPEMGETIATNIQRFVEWQHANRERVRFPD